MGLPRVKRVSSRRVINLDSLGSVADEFLEPEILSLTSQWGLEENRAQARQNPPNWASAVIIDRRYPTELKPSDSKRLAAASNVQFIGLKRNLRFIYTDLETLAHAAKYAWHRVRALTQNSSGFTRGSYRMWLQDPSNPGRTTEVKSADAMVRWVAASTSQDIRIEIQGPTASDRRKRIYGYSGQKSKWVSPSKAFNDGKAIDRYKFLKPKDRAIGRATNANGDPVQLRANKGNRGGLVLRASHGRKRTRYSAGVAQALQEVVQRQVRSKYRDIGVYYGFKPNKGDWAVRPGDRKTQWGTFIPVLSLTLKRRFGKGRVRGAL